MEYGPSDTQGCGMLQDIGQMFMTVGMCQQAVEAYSKVRYNSCC